MGQQNRQVTLLEDSTRFAALRSEWYIVPKGSDVGLSLLSLDDFQINGSTEIMTKMSQQGAVAKKAYSKPLTSSTDFTATLGNFSDIGLRALFNSSVSDGYYTQEAVADGQFAVVAANQKRGNIFRVLHPDTGMTVQNFEVDQVTWGQAGGAALVPVEGVDYTFDRRTGVIQLLRDKPANQTTAGSLILDYAIPEITASAGLLDIGVNSGNGGIECSMHGLAVNDDYLQFAIDLFDVLITQDGGVGVQNTTNEASTGKIKGEVRSAQYWNGKILPKKHQFGRIYQLSDVPLID